MTNTEIEYFEGFAELTEQAQKYVQGSLAFFDKCGFVELLVKNGKRARLGSLPEGSSRIDGNYVILDLVELEREVAFFNKFGSLMALPSADKSLIEIRLNLVVSHEMSHQIQFLLVPEYFGRFDELFKAKSLTCNHEAGGKTAELIRPVELEDRHFVTGYARLSASEYWAECCCSFSDKMSIAQLKKVDPDAHATLCELFLNPEKYLIAPWSSVITKIRAKHNITAGTVAALLK